MQGRVWVAVGPRELLLLWGLPSRVGTACGGPCAGRDLWKAGVSGA